MTYTRAVLVIWNGTKGIATDPLGTDYYIDKELVDRNDLSHLYEGADIIVSNFGHVELATEAFDRYRSRVEGIRRIK